MYKRSILKISKKNLEKYRNIIHGKLYSFKVNVRRMTFFFSPIFRLPSVEEHDSPSNHSNSFNNADVQEVPGIPNTTLTPSTASSSGASSSSYNQHALAPLGSTTSARSSASSECVWDSAFHGVVIALNRKTVSNTLSL